MEEKIKAEEIDNADGGKIAVACENAAGDVDESAAADENNKKSLWQGFKDSKFARFFVGAWRGFEGKHPKAAKLIAQFCSFIVFSTSVTVWQFLVMLFLPYAFESLASVPFVWPEVTLWTWADGTKAIFGIFNEPVLYNEVGEVIVGGGLGNFIAFEIAVFTAQCINFPLQRNITFKSHGNPWYQTLWYFIGWILVSIFVNAVWGFLNIFCIYWRFPTPLTAFIKTNLTGFISMAVFFFVFKIIFEDPKKAEN